MNVVMTVAELAPDELAGLLRAYRMDLVEIESGQDVPGSFWGEEEAGLIDNRLYVRADTPVHSALHETCHYICMSSERRARLDTDAGGDYDEENAVCYLQILLADYLIPMNRERMWQDMDAWGYSFRLGSAQTWFEQDAEDARQWLIEQQLIDETEQPLWQLRG